MSNPTTPFGWQMPTNTDLVTDLPADFEVFGQAVATSMQDLLGGTTGQILSKTSATDMDFTWTTPNPGDITGVTAGTGISGGGTSGDVTVTNSMATAIDAKGDLIAGTGADAFSRLAVGANGSVLTAASGEATGLQWTTPAAGGKLLQMVSQRQTNEVVSTSTTYAATGLSLSITPTSATSKILVMVSLPTRRYSNANAGIFYRILRAGGVIETYSPSVSLNTGGVLDLKTMQSFQYVDSPATTSATTYAIEFANENTVTGVRVFDSSTPGGIILMEIGA